MDGEGYAAVGRPTRWNPNVSTVAFKFRTFSSDALLMYLATEDMVIDILKVQCFTLLLLGVYLTAVSLWLPVQKDFMALELSEGKVKVNFDLGSGVGSANSANRHNDGRWKSLTMSRNKKQGGDYYISGVFITLTASFDAAELQIEFTNCSFVFKATITVVDIDSGAEEKIMVSSQGAASGLNLKENQRIYFGGLPSIGNYRYI